MSNGELLSPLVNGIIGLAIYAIKGDMKNVREVLQIRTDEHDRRITKAENEIDKAS